MSLIATLLRSKVFRRGLRTSAVFLAAFSYWWHIQALTPSMPDSDPYYHIKVASLVRDSGPLTSFPWARFSSWHDRYFDKDFLFHVLLVPFTSAELFAGAKLAVAVFGGLLVASFYWCLEETGVRRPLLFTAALFASGLGWPGRMVVLRGYLMSLPLLMLGIVAIFYERNLIAFMLSAVYALTYNAAFLLPLISFIYWGLLRLRGEKRRLILPLYCFAGLLVGIALHPNREHALYSLLLQNFSVLNESWLGGGSVQQALELGPYMIRDVLRFETLAFLAMVLSLIAIALRNRLATARELLLFGLSQGFFLLTLLSQRFCEYWTPLQIWCVALLFTGAAPLRFERLGALLSGALLIIPIRWNHNYLSEFMKRVTVPASVNAAAWFTSNSPGEGVFTCDWDDAAHLFFYNDKMHYLVMGDQMYMRAWNGEIWQRWRDVVEGRVACTADSILKDFSSNYVYCTKDFSGFIDRAKSDPNFELVFDGVRDVIFRVKDESEHPPCNADISRANSSERQN